MEIVPPTNLRDADKLEVLRRLDQHRHWHSLDEKRYCIVCCFIITGRAIQIVRDPPETGPLRAVCPTNECHSVPMDWVRPTDEILAGNAEASADAGPQPPMPDGSA